LYFSARFGAKAEPYTLVLDHSKGQNRGYDTLYMDAGRDGRITAEEMFTGMPDTRSIRFGPVKLPIDWGTEKCPQWFLFHFFEYESKEGQVHRHMHVTNAGTYQGLVTFGDQKQLLAVVDADANGIYNDSFKSAESPGDILLIDRNGDGKLDGGYRSEEAQPLGRYVLIGDRYWQLDLSPDGSAVIVEPLNKPLGTLHADVKDYSMLLLGEQGVLRARSHDGSAKVPAGKYRLFRCDYTLADKFGKRWNFSTQAAKEEAVMDVPARGEAKVRFGPPLVPKVMASRSADELTLSLDLRGSGGEAYSDVRIIEGRPPVPKVRILDASDRELAVLDFHYG